jgi:hypothetical protein
MSKTLWFKTPHVANYVVDHARLSARMFELATKASYSASTNTAAQKVVGVSAYYETSAFAFNLISKLD